MWVTRDSTGSVQVFTEEPLRYEYQKSPRVGWWMSKNDHPFSNMYESPDKFPEVTWENSPVEITTSLSKENLESAKKSIFDSLMSYIDHEIKDTESDNAFDSINRELYPNDDYKQGKLDTLKNIKERLKGRFNYEI